MMDALYSIGDQVQYTVASRPAVGTIEDNSMGNIYGGTWHATYKIRVRKSYWEHMDGKLDFVPHHAIKGVIFEG